MATLKGHLIRLAKRNRDGSESRQAQRLKQCIMIGETLRQKGYKLNHPRGLKEKHIKVLLQDWKEKKLSPGTIKNYLASARWWAEKIGKPHIIPKSNDALGVERRQYITNEDKSRSLESHKLDQIKDIHIKTSLQLQQQFGLRREEALKFQPRYADKGHKIVLKDSWCKGKRAREIPITTKQQRQLLDQAKQLAPRGSLIPAGRSYIQQLRLYERETRRVGLSKMHGLRHAYIHNRYHAITGWKAPAKGGPKRTELTPEQRQIDHAARLIIPHETGHNREEITAVYLGR